MTAQNFVQQSWIGAILSLSVSALPLSAIAATPQDANPRSPIIPGDRLAQVTSVSQLSDVQPTDWAFQALQSLVERYGCIAGYPDGTYRGNRAMTRYEFAAGLNACLDRVNELIVAATTNVITQEDLLVLQRLQAEFASELAILRGRVDALEARTAELEANQFSTTTKLRGEAIFAVTDVLAGDGVRVRFPASPFNPLTGEPQTSREFITPSQNTVLVNRVRLDFLTSFTGRDELKLRLTSGNSGHPGRRAPDNIGGFEFGPNPVVGYVSIGNQAGVGRSVEGQQTFQDLGRVSPNNQVGLTNLQYSFPIGSRFRTVVMAIGGEHFDYVPTTFSSWDDDNGGTGSLSVFAQRNPIYSVMGPGSGVGFTYDLTRRLSFSAGYLASEAFNPAQGNGLFDGRYSALAQLTFQPTDNLSLGLIYNRAYLPGGNLFNNDIGTILGNNPTFPPTAYTTNSYGFSGLWRVTPRFAVNGWVTYTDVEGASGTIAPGSPFEVRYNSSSASVLTYGIALAFPDLGRRGNLGGLVFGASPYVTRSRIPAPFSDPQSVPDNRSGFGTTDLLRRIPDRATPFHIEAFYVYRLNDNLFLTPGAIWLTAPNQTNRNPDVVLGTLRATFLF
ncbi:MULTISPECIES: iron uptake porin [Desertifilum]|uniref:iron uptake porin n=1 Tax=unclassified Desertifilum TaxID=2621682 RepID=UPI000B0A63A4|nr:MULTISPECIES: iron uptake porin [Desertifilum]MDA0213573.1 iron uptake porin [Cyanobacteria bacterium FC1]